MVFDTLNVMIRFDSGLHWLFLARHSSRFLLMKRELRWFSIHHSCYARFKSLARLTDKQCGNFTANQYGKTGTSWKYDSVFSKFPFSIHCRVLLSSTFELYFLYNLDCCASFMLTLLLRECFLSLSLRCYSKHLWFLSNFLNHAQSVCI